MKVSVVHTGARDHYQVAAAFAERGELLRLVTSGYSGKGLLSFQRYFASNFFTSRRSAAIPDRLVKSSILPDLGKALGQRLGGAVFASSLAEVAFSHAAAIAVRESDVVVAYNYLAHLIFPKVKSFRVLFQCHPNPAALAQLGISDGELLKSGFAVEREVAWGHRYRVELEREWSKADAVIAPSSFVKRSLVAAGADRDRVVVVPYGCDAPSSLEPRELPEGRRRRLLFVGQLVWRKGADLLHFAASKFAVDCELHVVTRGLFDSTILAQLSGLSNVVIHRGISNHALSNLYRQCDALLFPSRFEGYGLVINEALSHAMPVISTKSTALADVFITHRAGILMEDASEREIARGMDELFTKRQYESASREALQFANENTWQEFRAKVREAVTESYETTR